MSLRALDWARPVGGIFAFWAAGLAILGFSIAWWLLSFDRHFQRPDVGFYQGVGEAVARGLVPYRDFDPALLFTLTVPETWALVVRSWFGRLAGRPPIPMTRPATLGGSSIAVQPALMRFEHGRPKE